MINSFILIGVFGDKLEDSLMAWKPRSEKLDQGGAELRRELEARTKGVQADDALRDTESKYRDLVETINDIIWEVSAEGVYTYVSPRVFDILGYKPEELLDKPLSVFQGHDEDKRSWDLFLEVIKEQKPFSVFKVTYQHKNGSIITLETSGKPFFNANSELIGFRGVSRDVTEYERSKNELREEREKLISIFDTVDEVIYVSDPETYEFIYVNEAFRKNWGDGVGGKCYSVLQGRDAPCIPCVNDRIFGSNKGAPYIWEYQNKVNGRWYRCIDKAMSWPDGRIVRYELAIDIHDRKQSERALLESEERFRDVLEASNDWVWEIDPEGNYTYASSKVKNVLGYSPEEIVGRKIYSTMSEEEAERISEIFKNNTEKMVPFTIPENTNFHKNGSRVVEEISGIPIFDSKEGLLGWRGLAHDITMMKRAEEEIRKSEERLTNVHLAVNDGIWEWDAEKNIITYSSDRFSEIMGFKKNKAISFDQWVSRLHPDQRDNILEELRKTAFGESVLDIEYRYRGKGDDYIWISATAMLVSSDKSDERRVVGSVRDITSRKMAEEEKRELQAQLQQVQKMEAIGTLAGGIAHDFNNLLQSIIINTELGLSELKDEGIDDKRLKQIFKASGRAKELVKQIVTFSRQKEQKQGPLKLIPLVKESLKLLRSTLPANIEVRERMRAGEDTIMADPTQINQILMNLCTNAAHAMKKRGGVLEVSLLDVDLNGDAADINAELKPGEYVILEVRDTGHGMDKEVLERIFDPFFTTKGPGEGSGMGLSVVHGIVKGCKGTISVESELGKSTLFRIFFPRVEEAVALVEKDFEPLPRGNDQILLVDDEVFILDSLKPALENLGYIVVACRDGKKAQDMFSNRPERFDLVIADYSMPNMSGVEMAEKLRTIKPDIPIILCTGFSDIVTEENVKAAGIKELLMKPLVTNDIANAIRRVLDVDK